MEEYKKCDKGWHDGSCCCNCKNFIELFQHPQNIVFSGKVTHSANLRACIVAFDMDGTRKGIISEDKHGMCELHVPINK